MLLVDDVGSFPLPEGVTKAQFAEIYPGVQKALAQGEDPEEDPAFKTFNETVASSLRFKIDSGLDVVNYPQHYDMHKQFLDPILHQQTEPFLIAKDYAVIPELYVAEKVAKEHHEETGVQLRLKVCVTGPIELYLKTDFGFTVYEEVLFNLAKSVNLFIDNAIFDEPHIKTEVVAIDEPSLGFVDLLNIEQDGLVQALDTALDGVKPTVQVHLHTLKAVEIPLETKNIDCLTGEFAATPMNMKLISQETLESHDKYIRAGVTRTNIDSIIAEFVEKGASPKDEDLVDGGQCIRDRLEEAREAFGDRMTFAGPDCGLGSWPSQEVAGLLLRRTVETIRSSGTD